MKYLLIALFLGAVAFAYYDTVYLLPERQGEIKVQLIEALKGKEK